jgi:hypothetical protein
MGRVRRGRADVEVGTGRSADNGLELGLSNVRNDNKTELFRFTFRLSNVKKLRFTFHSSET